MKDTKGIRQVLEEVHKAHYDTIDGTDGCNVSIEKAESALQEIMLGMLPEESHTCVTHKHLPCAGCTVQLIEQNIRGGFKV